MPDHPVECVLALGLMDAVGSVDLGDIARRIVMPDRMGFNGRAVGFLRRRFAVPIIVVIMSGLKPWIGHVRQVARVVVGESRSGSVPPLPAGVVDIYTRSHHRHCAS